MKTLQEFALIVKAEFKRDLLFMYRYPLEILSFLFFMYLILILFVIYFVIWNANTFRF